MKLLSRFFVFTLVFLFAGVCLVVDLCQSAAKATLRRQLTRWKIKRGEEEEKKKKGGKKELLLGKQYNLSLKSIASLFLPPPCNYWAGLKLHEGFSATVMI